MTGRDHEYPRRKPGPVTGRDGAGAITVVLADDGLPELIRVDPDWRRLVGADGFAAAVTRAGANAVDAYDDATLEVDPDTGPPRSVEAVAHRERPPIWPMHFTSWMLEDLSRGFQATKLLAERRRRGPLVGTAALGRLTLTFGPAGAMVCAADGAWVAQQETAGLASALATALASLRAARAGSETLRDTVVAAAISIYGRGGRAR
jgi:hypothetical protein